MCRIVCKAKRSIFAPFNLHPTEVTAASPQLIRDFVLAGPPWTTDCGVDTLTILCTTSQQPWTRTPAAHDLLLTSIPPMWSCGWLLGAGRQCQSSLDLPTEYGLISNLLLSSLDIVYFRHTYEFFSITDTQQISDDVTLRDSLEQPQSRTMSAG